MGRPVFRPTRSILRPASTDCSNGSCIASTNKRVTFADDLNAILTSSPPVRSRRAPPSIAPPINIVSLHQSHAQLPAAVASSDVDPNYASANHDHAAAEPPERAVVKDLVVSAPRGSTARPSTPGRSPAQSKLRRDAVARPGDDAAWPSPELVRSSESRHRHRRHHHRCKKHGEHGNCGHRRRGKSSDTTPSALSSETRLVVPIVEDAVAQSERAARQKRKREGGVVKKRTSPDRRRESVRSREKESLPTKQVSSPGGGMDGKSKRASRNEVAINAEAPPEPEPNSTALAELPKRKVAQRRQKGESKGKDDVKSPGRKQKNSWLKRESRIKHLRSRGLLFRAKEIITLALDLSRDGYSRTILDAVGAKTIYKLYVQCRERAPAATGLELREARHWHESKIRRKLIEEEEELSALLSDQAKKRKEDSEETERRKALKKKRGRLARFVAQELGSESSSVQKLSKSLLEKAVISAAAARVQRMELRVRDASTFH